MNGLRRILPFLRPYKWVVTGMILTTVLPVAAELVTPRVLQFVIDQGIVPGDFEAIWQGALLMLGAAVLGALATIFQGYCRAQLSQGLAFDMRNRMFAHIQSFAFADLDRMQTGQLMTRLSSDVDVVRMFASAGVSLLLRALLMIIGSVILMMLTDLRLSLIAFGMLILAGIVVRTILKLTAPLFEEVQARLGALSTLVQENLAGVQVVKAFVREDHAVARYAERNTAYMAQNIRVGYLMVTVLPLLTIITNLGLVAVIWWGGGDVIVGRLSVGELVAFVNYLMIGMGPLLLLSNILTMISRANVSASRMVEVLDTVPAIRPIAAPHTAATVQGHVVFDNVRFAYGTGASMLGSAAPAPQTHGTRANGTHANGTPHNRTSQNGAGQNGAEHAEHNGADHNHTGIAAPQNQTASVAQANGAEFPQADDTVLGQAVLDGISFEVQAGQRIAILGATGAGKSTLVHLVPRFYDVTGGRI
ncbi:MAG: ABC transporter transmembrane domain-containing protein, partial [Litorilinea sp.]